ncbi:LacI family DNA-binding transcriptional regulator [Paenibacillus sp. MBLB4367]|uniref:LacI family DNA-binding transcriptional regulator n=1 Tax=Paenibacillus sp. MBLB4367 TaxID=3384767 RepID=UPI0039084241
MQKLTIKEVAQEAGVSTATISRVLNNSGYVNEDVKKHVLQVINKLNYKPNAIARSLKQEKSRSIGIVLPDMTNPYFMRMARSIQTRCVAEGYHLLFIDTEDNPLKEKEAIHFLTEKRVEALILAGTGENRELIKSVSRSVYVVLADRPMSALRLDTVAEDNTRAVKSAVGFLLANGHTRIGVIKGPESTITARERYEGVLQALSEAGITPDPELAFSGDYARDSGTQAIRQFMALAEPPTAVFSANNEMTFGLYLGLQQLQIPLDFLEVVSFGDLEFSSLFRHRLSVIKQNPQQLGEAVGELVVKKLGTQGGAAENRIFVPEWIPNPNRQ